MPSLPYASFANAIVLSVLPLALVIYFFLVWDARRPDSAAAGDGQIGLKTVGAALTLVGVGMLAMGLKELLFLLLTFDDFVDRLKALLPDLLVGAGTVGVAAFVLVPRTNAAEFPKSKRLTAGAIALVAGTITVAALSAFIKVVLDWPSWESVAEKLTELAVSVVFFGVGMFALGKLSGLQMATQQPQPQPGQPMAHPGMGGQAPQPGPAAYPQQQGYPGQQPGYPAQQQPGVAPPQQPPYPPHGQQ